MRAVARCDTSTGVTDFSSSGLVADASSNDKGLKRLGDLPGLESQHVADVASSDRGLKWTRCAAARDAVWRSRPAFNDRGLKLLGLVQPNRRNEVADASSSDRELKQRVHLRAGRDASQLQTLPRAVGD